MRASAWAHYLLVNANIRCNLQLRRHLIKSNAAVAVVPNSHFTRKYILNELSSGIQMKNLHPRRLRFFVSWKSRKSVRAFKR